MMHTLAAAIGTLRPEDLIIGLALACVGVGIMVGLIVACDAVNRRKSDDWMAEGNVRR